MKKLFSMVATLTVLVLGLSLSSCTKEEDIYGCWQDQTAGWEDEYIVISEDGNYYECSIWSGSWTIKSKQTYTFKKGDIKLSNGDNYEVELDGDYMTLSLDVKGDLFGFVEALSSSTYKKCEMPAGLQEAINAAK